MQEDSLKRILYMLKDKNIKYYDDEINTTELKTIKALVAYMDLESQRQIAIIIKIFEFKLLMDLYSKKIDPHQKHSDQPNIKKNKKRDDSNIENGIINALKIYLPDNVLDMTQIIIESFYPDQNDKSKNPAGKNLSMASNSKQMPKRSDDTIVQDIFNDDAFKGLTPENMDILKSFIKDISDKSPMEAVGIIIKYNNKMPKNISQEQKNLMINALLKKMPSDKRTQFINLYNMFIKK